MLRTRRVRIVLASVASIAALLLLFEHFFPTPDVRSWAKMTDCEAHMRIAGRALFAFAEDHRDIPRGENGEFSPDMLICKSHSAGENCVPASQARCLLRRIDGPAWDGLIWCKEMPDFQSKAFVPGHPESSLKKFVVMCHDPDSLHRVNDKCYAPVLLSDGRVVFPTVDATEYRLWLDTEFRHGNLAIPLFISNQFDLRDFP